MGIAQRPLNSTKRMLLTFTQTDNHILIERSGRMPVAIALINPERAAEILASRGLTYTIALMIASGALGSRESTTALAKYCRLVQ